MWRCGENRIIEKVFPIPDEVSARHHDRRQHRLRPAGGGDHYRRFLGERGRRADRDRLDRQWFGCAQQAEPRGDVEADDIRPANPARPGRHLCSHSLGDQIADRHDKTGIVDHHARAIALRAEIRGGPRIGRDLGMDPDDCLEPIRQFALRSGCDPPGPLNSSNAATTAREAHNTTFSPQDIGHRLRVSHLRRHRPPRAFSRPPAPRGGPRHSSRSPDDTDAAAEDQHETD